MEIGFKRGVSTPCVFYHKERNLRVVVHGDDFTVLGHSEQMDWFREEISKMYVVKFRARLGAEDRDDRAVRILNRIVEWRKEGIWYEPDQRHAEIIQKELILENDSKGLGSPNYKREEI